MGINLASNAQIAAWMEYAKEHQKEFASYDGCCGCPSCREYRIAFHRWYDKREAAKAGGQDGA